MQARRCRAPGRRRPLASADGWKVYSWLHKEEHTMGKGDQKTRRGKLYRGSYGKARPRKRKKIVQEKKR
jgi:30S ribosomal protein S31